MGAARIIIAQEVSASTDEVEYVTPANGQVVQIISFHGSAAYTTNSACLVVWDYDTENEEVIWSIKGESHIKELDIRKTGDGTKKLAVILSNGESGAVYMSGLMEYRNI